MKFFSVKLHTSLAISLLIASISCQTKKEDKSIDVDVLALTPPMGWNSYNTFGIDINAEKVMRAADAMVSSGMAEAGYEYVVIDDGWQIARDENGKIIADSTRFPDGMKHVVDYVHSKGLKFGIYTDMGTMTCGSLPGSYGYEEIDAQTYAEWGVDFIKADWCFTDGLETRAQYKKLSDAIKATGRPMLLSICEWGSTSPWEWGKGIGAMWRTTNDIQDCFDCVRDWGGMGWVPILEKNVDLAPYAGPGHWNDPDMLEVGNKGLNIIESKSHFSMWCMLAAPLIAGNNLHTMNDTIRDILTAPELIAINQDALGMQATRLSSIDGLQVWQKPLSDGSIAVALLNVSDTDAPMFVSLEDIGLKPGVESTVRDLWKREDLPVMTDIFQTDVASHGVVVVKIKGEKVPASSMAFEKDTIELNEANHTIIQVQVEPPSERIQVASSNEDIVSVAIAGVNKFRLSAKKAGVATLEAKTAEGTLTATTTVLISPSTIPSPWKFEDIKDYKSSANYVDGVFYIEGAGNDIWGGFDQFAFVSQPVEQDSYISAQVVSQSSPEPWAKSGLMIRESNAADSRFVMLSVTPRNGISVQWRKQAGKGCGKEDFKGIPFPFYMKLSSKGSAFKAFTSLDGQSWKLLYELTLDEPFNDQQLAGLAASAHSTQSLNFSTFDEVEVGKE